MYTLIIWTIVGFAGMQYSTLERYDWRPLSTHTSQASCERAAQQLGSSPNASAASVSRAGDLTLSQSEAAD